MQICLDNRLYLAHRLGYLYVHGEFPSEKLDHIDRDKTNNRVQNLRPATHKQNSENKGIQANNTSGYKGVSWSKQRSKWVAVICQHQKNLPWPFQHRRSRVRSREAMRDKLFTHHHKKAALICLK